MKQHPIIYAVITVAVVFSILACFYHIDSKRRLTLCGRSANLANATALEAAVSRFFDEYGYLPDVGSRVKTDSPEGVRLLSILLGLEEGSDKLKNTRRIKFLNVHDRKQRRDGIYYNPAGRPEGLYDRWGNAYTVELDDQNKEHLQFTIASKSVDLKGRRAAAYSSGKDKKLGTADDITTW